AEESFQSGAYPLAAKCRLAAAGIAEAMGDEEGQGEALSAAAHANLLLANHEEAARFAGVRVKRQKLILFTVTGLMSALTGVFWALHYASARYDNATGLELSVVAAVLLGGIDFDGGKGTLGGAIAGVFLLGALQNVM
ncbi:ABC transporter permease, partial [Streptomyces sp. DH12]|uniref:ABC transporter permease n=1 Tax=Streptomyces sp. DH12 TaxID=2857010 RepID=UPI0034D52B62